MASKQASRYIKQRLGDEPKNKILERHGIRSQMVSRICWKCQYVNKLESKYCERVGCNYPLTQLALDEIKAAERAEVEALRNEILETKTAQQKKEDEMQEPVFEEQPG